MRKANNPSPLKDAAAMDAPATTEDVFQKLEAAVFRQTPRRFARRAVRIMLADLAQKPRCWSSITELRPGAQTNRNRVKSCRPLRVME